MKVVVTCQPARGHFHPLLPLVRALQAQGHEPLVATSASFAPVVERAGVAAIATGADWLESAVDTAFPDLVADGTELGSIQRIWPQVFSRAARQFLPHLAQLLDSIRPDIVLSEAFEWSGPLAAEAAGIPHAQLGIGPLMPAALMAQRVGRYWEGARESLGLPPDPTLDRLAPNLYLSMYPPSFQPLPLPALSRVAVSVRPAVIDVDGERIEPTGSRPLVYVMMGTVFNRVRGPFETVLEALAAEPVQVVAAVGENRDPAEVAPLARNVRLTRFVRQADLLSHADVIVFHGGSATTVAALSNGVPSLAIPLGADQAYNAFRLAAAGAGMTLPFAELSVDRVRTAVEHLLGNPLYQSNAERLRTEVDGLLPIAQAVALLERLPSIATDPRRG
jgi:UDP:flavonoid glycosyltransferase YjiC (YdhE family)